MPNQRQRGRTRVRREPPRPQMSPAADCFMREMMMALFRCPLRPPSASERHLKNAAIEVLEAIRALLDAAIARLREEGSASDLRRIQVED
jgi:hypothetical protein